MRVLEKFRKIFMHKVKSPVYKQAKQSHIRKNDFEKQNKRFLIRLITIKKFYCFYFINVFQKRLQASAFEYELTKLNLISQSGISN